MKIQHLVYTGFLAFASIFNPINSFADNISSNLCVRINIPSYELAVYNGEEEVKKFEVRVGKSDSPTPLGEGIIGEKRERIFFRYLEGERKGKVIRYSYLEPEKRSIRMPYEKMRALQMLMKRGNKFIDEGKVIHSTTDYWTVGFPVSHGCIGLRIEDMQELFDTLKNEDEIELNLSYETIFVRDGKVFFYPDIYNRGTNSLERVIEKGVAVGNKGRARDKINMINIELDDRVSQARREIQKGKNPLNYKYNLVYCVSASEF
ncbi:MAG: L,D-transpeptidase [archaeon]